MSEVSKVSMDELGDTCFLHKLSIEKIMCHNINSCEDWCCMQHLSCVIFSDYFTQTNRASMKFDRRMTMFLLQALKDKQLQYLVQVFVHVILVGSTMMSRSLRLLIRSLSYS